MSGNLHVAGSTDFLSKKRAQLVTTATRLTHAVTTELLRRGLPTIALSVNQHNAAAIHIYESLGFERYCPFKEGLAVRLEGMA